MAGYGINFTEFWNSSTTRGVFIAYANRSNAGSHSQGGV